MQIIMWYVTVKTGFKNIYITSFVSATNCSNMIAKNTQKIWVMHHRNVPIQSQVSDQGDYQRISF